MADTAQIDLEITQGEDWTVQMQFTDDHNEPYHLVGAHRMDIVDDTGSVIVSLTNPEFPPDMDPSIPEIAVSSGIGLIQLHLTSAVTDGLIPGTYYYDLWGHVDDGDVYAGEQALPLAEGSVTIKRRITETF